MLGKARRLALLADGHFTPLDAKTAVGVKGPKLKLGQGRQVPASLAVGRPGSSSPDEKVWPTRMRLTL